MRMRRSTAALLISGLVLSGCAGAEDLQKRPEGASVAEGQLVADVARQTPHDPPVGEAVEGLRLFGYQLYGQVARDSINVVASPLSIAYAFAMARAGAVGPTAQQIDDVLHFPARVHDAYNELDHELVTTDTAPPPPAPTPSTDADEEERAPQPPILAVANGLFSDDDLAIEPAFLEVLAGSYGAGVEIVDFGRATAADRINAWVQRHTSGRIDRLFPQLPESTRLVLANAVYFKASWQRPLQRGPSEPFTRADGTVVQASMLRSDTTVPYAAGDGWQAVELAYHAGEHAMWILVPELGTDPGRLLDPAMLTQVGQGLSPQLVELHLPAWDFATDLDLVAPLRALGMHAPFDQADFSAMTKEAVAISQAVHRANITVDEWGTEAAAATGLAFAVSAPPPPEIVVRADHPFAYVIVHRPTGTPLFLGHVGDPTLN